MTGPSVWPSKGLPCSALAWSTNWPPLGWVTGVAIDHLAAELVGCPGLALADALDLGRMQRIDLGAALAMVLVAHLVGQIEQRGEARFQLRVAFDLAADVADDPAEPGAQELERPPGALELVGVAVAADHDGGALGHPHDSSGAAARRCAWRARPASRSPDASAGRRSDGQSPSAAPWCRPPPAPDPWSPARRSCAPPTGSPGAARPAAPRPAAGASASSTSDRTAAGGRSSTRRRSTGNRGSPASARTAPRPRDCACA